MSKAAFKTSLGVSSELWTGSLSLRSRKEAAPTGWLGQARRAGYAGVTLDPGSTEDPQELAIVLADHGLALAAADFVGGLLELTLEEEKRRLGPALDPILATGCRLLAYTDFTRSVRHDEDVTLADRPQLRRDDIRRYGEKLTKLADWLLSEGAVLCYQPRLGTVIVGEAEIDLLLESSDVSVGLVLDTGTLAFAGAEPAAMARRRQARLRQVQVQAVREDLAARAQEERWSFPRIVKEGVFTVPGDEAGSLDLDAVSRSLAETGYQGWIIARAERDSAQVNPLEQAEMAFAALSEALSAAAATTQQTGQ